MGIGERTETGGQRGEREEKCKSPHRTETNLFSCKTVTVFFLIQHHQQ